MAMFMACNTNVVFSGRKSHGYQDIEKASKYFSKENDVFIRVKRILKKWDLGLDDILIEEEINKDESDEEQVRYHTYGVHKLKDGKSFNLPFVFESAGTKSAYVRLYDILLSLDTGAHCFIDELGDDLHPHMIKPILELFSDRESNPLGAQLVFTCHKPELINYLGKNRIIICEKKYNESECFRLDDFSSSQARVDDNLAAKYLAGVFGGVPDL